MTPAIPTPEQPAAAPEAILTARTIREALKWAADQVTIAERNLDDTIAKAHKKGATYRDIGGILDISQGTAAARARRSSIDPAPADEQTSVLDQPLA